uniref:Uncharacterized protein n=1 Tax=Populus trichocarpa TaxID=3694 RepID=A0A2K1ZCP5_POPTR
MKDFPPPKKWKCSCQDFFLPVAASTIDRKSLTRGTSIYTFTLEHDMHPIFYAGDVQYNKEGYNASMSCYSMHTGSLDKKLVKGKIVLCGSIAWSQGNSVTGLQGDIRVVRDNIISSTSMACPLFSMSAETNPEEEFAYGSGHINPVRVINPGLTYDAGGKIMLNSCVDKWNLNYPSSGLTALSSHSITHVFHRTVTDVGSPESKLQGNCESS